MAGEEPKIFIDEDWKAQVQREKAEAEAPAQAAPEKEGPVDEDHPGEASFTGLVQSLAAQCAFSLGLIAPPDTDKVMVNLEEAQYYINTMIVLRDKTKGHLTPEEEGSLTQAIGELQQAYVVRAQQIQEAALRQSGIDLKKPRNR